MLRHEGLLVNLLGRPVLPDLISEPVHPHLPDRRPPRIRHRKTKGQRVDRHVPRHFPQLKVEVWPKTVAPVTHPPQLLPLANGKSRGVKVQIDRKGLPPELLRPHRIPQFRREKIQVSVHAPVPVRMINVNRLPVPARRHQHPAHEAVRHAVHRRARPRPKVQPGVKMVAAQFTEGTRHPQFALQRRRVVDRLPGEGGGE